MHDSSSAASDRGWGDTYLTYFNQFLGRDFGAEDTVDAMPQGPEFLGDPWRPVVALVLFEDAPDHLGVAIIQLMPTGVRPSLPCIETGRCQI